MDIQVLIVFAIIAAAVVFIAEGFRRKTRSMTNPKSTCGNDCGCGDSGKRG